MSMKLFKDLSGVNLFILKSELDEIIAGKESLLPVYMKQGKNLSKYRDKVNDEWAEKTDIPHDAEVIEVAY